jgi:hypothetical protein
VTVARYSVLLSRIEDAGINASAPPQQRWMDGWLVRFSAGKAKRSRCINAAAPGRLSVERNLELCRPLYAAAQLPLFVRVTPFSDAGLDDRLERLGMSAQDDTRVMVRPSLDLIEPTLPGGSRLARLTPHALADLVGGFRGATSAQRELTPDASRTRRFPFTLSRRSTRTQGRPSADSSPWKPN